MARFLFSFRYGAAVFLLCMSTSSSSGREVSGEPKNSESEAEYSYQFESASEFHQFRKSFYSIEALRSSLHEELESEPEILLSLRSPNSYTRVRACKILANEPNSAVLSDLIRLLDYYSWLGGYPESGTPRIAYNFPLHTAVPYYPMLALIAHGQDAVEPLLSALHLELLTQSDGARQNNVFIRNILLALGVTGNAELVGTLQSLGDAHPDGHYSGIKSSIDRAIRQIQAPEPLADYLRMPRLRGFEVDLQDIPVEAAYDLIEGEILGNGSQRTAAIRSLGTLQTRRAVPLLLSLLREGNRGAAVPLIEQGAGSVDGLLLILHGENQNHAMRAAALLGEISDSRAIIPLIEVAFNKRHIALRAEAAKALVRINSPTTARAAFGWLLYEVEKGTLVTRSTSSAMEEIIRGNHYTPDEMRQLVEGMSLYAEHVRRMLERMLEHLETYDEKKFRRKERRWLDATEILSNVISFISRDGDPRFQPTLDFLTSFPELSNSAIRAYGSLRKIDDFSRLATILQTGKKGARSSAIHSLSRSGDSRAVRYLVPYIDDPDREIAGAARGAIRSLRQGVFTSVTLATEAEEWMRSGEQGLLWLVARVNASLFLEELAFVLSFGDRDQRMDVHRRFKGASHPYALPAASENVPLLADLILKTKGIVIDSLIEDRALALHAQDDTIRRLHEELIEESKKWTGMSLEAQASNHGQAIANRIASIESELARRLNQYGNVRRSLTLTVADLKGALPKESVVLEFVNYPFWTGSEWSDHYGVMIIGAGNSQPSLTWIDLGASEEIDARIRRFHVAIANNLQETKEFSRQLHDLLWKPVEEQIPEETRYLYISPDSSLNSLSFSTLISDENVFLGEQFLIAYLASSRDLIMGESTTVRNRSIGILANPDFGDPETPVDVNLPSDDFRRLRQTDIADLRGIALTPLHGAEREGRRIAVLAESFGFLTELTIGTDASEKRFSQKDTGIIHLATHGFFLPPPSEDSVGMSPMNRSGLALAGAQHTLNAWAEGRFPDPNNDGILTAAEVGVSNFPNTWLAVLSACETGAGEFRSGEGVIGLRRGFHYAGVRNLIMTLWPISDDFSERFMLDFYEVLFGSSSSPAEALAITQRKHLQELRSENGVNDAIRLAGPFFLSGRDGFQIQHTPLK